MTTLRIRGRRWQLAILPLSGDDAGSCDPPDVPYKTIQIDANLEPDETLRVLIHEMLHAALWDLSEEAVDETSADIAAVLWQLGYRTHEVTPS